jgi:hypothetical protein
MIWERWVGMADLAPRRWVPRPRGRNGSAISEHGFGVAPGMGRKQKVKVLLEPRQKESNTEDKGSFARGCLVEVVCAARNRAKAKHRKACKSWVSEPPVAKPEICWSTVRIGDGFARSFLTRTRGDLSASRGDLW